jgi:hypothetical protein
MMLQGLLLVGVAGVAGLLAFGCSGDSAGGDGTTGGASTCAVLVPKLQECGIITQGRVECDDADGFSPCVNGCLQRAACADLRGSLCVGTDTSLDACAEQCEANEATFQCADGQETVPMSWKCDGEEDCFDGSDELGCPTGISFACADGQDTIPMSWKCDGEEDCLDGSDEVGCPAGATFPCADGLESVPQASVCDLYPDCLDGSDEAQGCARFIDCDPQW